jgi:hypothetical protein
MRIYTCDKVISHDPGVLWVNMVPFVIDSNLASVIPVQPFREDRVESHFGRAGSVT